MQRKHLCNSKHLVCTSNDSFDAFFSASCLWAMKEIIKERKCFDQCIYLNVIASDSMQFANHKAPLENAEIVHKCTSDQWIECEICRKTMAQS